MSRAKTRLTALLLAFCAGAANAEAIVSADSLPATENGVFTADGRYFVAGGAGIHEVRPADPGGVVPQGCALDHLHGHAVCQLVAPALDGAPCFFTGMTTDGVYLYAACTATDNIVRPSAAALFRIRPGADEAQVKIGRFATPVWYNGMAMAPDGGILMSNSAAGTAHRGPGAAIVKASLKGSSGDELLFELSDWLPASFNYFMPNGIAVDGNTAYFVGGQNLFRIAIKPDGRPGLPIPIYLTGGGQLLDDLTLAGNRVAVAEIAMYGIGFNRIVSVPKSGWGLPRTLSTGAVRLSSLAVSPGDLGRKGELIATSYFESGLHLFPQP